jgi:hypothetical protein
MFRSSTILRELVWSLVKVTLYFVLTGYVLWQHVLRVVCVLRAVQNGTEFLCKVKPFQV